MLHGRNAAGHTTKTHAGQDGDLTHIYFLTADQTVNGVEDVLDASETLNEAGKQGKNSDPGGPNLSKYQG